MRARLTSGKTPLLIGLMAAVFAASFVVPAIGGPSVGKAFSKAKKAIGLANKAQDTANQALAEPDLIGARAFARFNPLDGGTGATVDTARSSSGVTVLEPSNGVFCVRFPGISSASSPAVATADSFSTNTAASTAEVKFPSSCATASDFEVQVKSESAGASGLAVLTDFSDGVSVVVP